MMMKLNLVLGVSFLIIDSVSIECLSVVSKFNSRIIESRVLDARLHQSMSLSCDKDADFKNEGSLSIRVVHHLSSISATWCDSTGIKCSDLSKICTLRLRGGKKSMTDEKSRALWYKKYPLGMALYDAAGGVGPGPEDTWYDESNMTLVNELIERGANVSFQGLFQCIPEIRFAHKRLFL
jgi:hypothetical protein